MPSVACRSSPPQSWPAEDRIVLDDAAWQFGLSSFVLGHFFFLGMGLGLSIKWAGVAKLFDPTVHMNLNYEDKFFFLFWLLSSTNFH